MMKIFRQLVVIAMLGMVSATGAFAQRRGQDKDKRPPKEPVKVITNDRKDNRPPRGEQKPKQDNPRRGRPFF